MNSTAIRRFAFGALAATTMLAFVPSAAGSAQAAEPARIQTANNLKQIGIAVHDGDGVVDGRDFLVWQRGTSPSAADGAGTSDLANWQSNYGAGGY